MELWLAPSSSSLAQSICLPSLDQIGSNFYLKQELRNYNVPCCRRLQLQMGPTPSLVYPTDLDCLGNTAWWFNVISKWSSNTATMWRMNLTVLAAESRNQDRRQALQAEPDLPMYFQPIYEYLGALFPPLADVRAGKRVAQLPPIQVGFTMLPSSRTPLVSLVMSYTHSENSMSVHKALRGGKTEISLLSDWTGAATLLIYASIHLALVQWSALLVLQGEWRVWA